MRKRNGVQSAGADDDGFHKLGSLVLTGWAATGYGAALNQSEGIVKSFKMTAVAHRLLPLPPKTKKAAESPPPPV